MDNTSGFYKLDNGTILFAPNGVVSSAYELYREQHKSYNYPVDGWYWFDAQEDADAFLL